MLAAWHHDARRSADWLDVQLRISRRRLVGRQNALEELRDVLELLVVGGVLDSGVAAEGHVTDAELLELVGRQLAPVELHVSRALRRVRTGTTGSASPCPANHGNDLEMSDIIEPILERSGM